MQACQIELQENTSLMIGVMFSPAFPFWHLSAIEGFLKVDKPKRWVFKHLKTYGLASARNQMVQYAILNKFTHILLLDADVILEKDTITKMLLVNDDVVVAYVPQKPTGESPCIKHSELPHYRDRPVPYKEGEAVKDFMMCGMGCVLIKRQVLEEMEFPYFRYSSQEYDLPDFWLVSEDYYFFLKLDEMGIKPVFLSDAKVKHITQAALTDRGLVSI